MRRALTVVLLGCLTAACGTEPADDGAEEAAATAVTGKSDSLAERIVFGKFENDSPRSGTFASLELIEAVKSELPAAHYEGRYVLEETRAAGVNRSEGAFNVYRYGGTDWIRFEDDERGTRATTSEKYSWSIGDGVMRLESVSGERFGLQLIEDAPVRYQCRYGVEDSEYLEYDVSDPYDETPAQLIATLEAGDLSAADSVAVRIATAAADHEGTSLEEFVGNFDEGLVEVYELSWFSSAYEMVRGWRGDTEVGYVFDAGFDDVIAEISDGDIIGCEDGECDWDKTTIFPDTSSFHGEPLATEIDFIDSVDKLTELMEEQLRVAMTDDWTDASRFSAQELLDHTDDGGFTYYEVGDTMHWLKWYGGDNEVGAFFEKGTTNLVGRVGDGDVSACEPAP